MIDFIPTSGTIRLTLTIYQAQTGTF